MKRYIASLFGLNILVNSL